MVNELNSHLILKSVHNCSRPELICVCDLSSKQIVGECSLTAQASALFPNLCRVDLKDNLITSIENLKHLNQLKWLSVANNRLESNALMFLREFSTENLRVLNVSNNRINTLDGIDSSKIQKSLLALIATDNMLAQESLNSFKLYSPSTAVLNSLIVSNNNIECIANELQTLTRLGKFSVSNNGLEKIAQDAFSQNVDLRELRLAKNKLKELPQGLGKNINLRVLDASHNKIDSFTSLQVLAKLPKLAHLSLRGNPVAILDGKAYVENIKALCPRLRTLDGHPLANHPATSEDYVDNVDDDDGKVLEVEVDDDERKEEKKKHIVMKQTFGLKRANRTSDDDDNDDDASDDKQQNDEREDSRANKKRRGKRGKKKKDNLSANENLKKDRSFLETIITGENDEEEEFKEGDNNDDDEDDDREEEEEEEEGEKKKKLRQQRENKIPKLLGREIEKQKPLSDKEFDEKLERDRMKQQGGVVKVVDVKVHRHKNKVFGSDVFKKVENKSAWDESEDDVDDNNNNNNNAIITKYIDSEPKQRIVEEDEKTNEKKKKKKSSKEMSVEELKAHRKLQRKRGY